MEASWCSITASASLFLKRIEGFEHARQRSRLAEDWRQQNGNVGLGEDDQQNCTDHRERHCCHRKKAPHGINLALVEKADDDEAGEDVDDDYHADQRQLEREPVLERLPEEDQDDAAGDGCECG